MMTFPQVVIDGESIGGYQELVAADRSGRLHGLRAKPPPEPLGAASSCAACRCAPISSAAAV